MARVLEPEFYAADPSYVDRAQHVGDILDALPPSEGEIAQLFSDEGICGRVRDTHCCPVTNFLRKETGEDNLNFYEVLFVEGVMVKPENPYPTEFAKKFDNGHYPALIDNS